MSNFKVKNCDDCPFHEFDHVWIEHDCYLMESGKLSYDFETLPENCPLKKGAVEIELYEVPNE
jgi:hypothetical protein